MAGQQVEQGMKFGTKLGLYAIGGFLLISFILAFGIVGIVVAGALVAAIFWARSQVREKGKAGVAGEMARALYAASVHVFRCEVQAASRALGSKWGVRVLFGIGILVALTMIVTGRVGFPFVGFVGLLAIGYIYGRGEVKRWSAWMANTEKTLAAVVPAFVRTEDERRATRYGKTWLARRLGVFDGFYEFEVELPKAVRASHVFGMQEHLRERLRAAQSVSWGFDVDLQHDLFRGRAIPALPTSLTMSSEFFGDLDAVTRDAVGFVSPLEERHASSDPSTFIPLGRALEESISWDLSNLFGCILVVGAPGGGKSCAIRTIFFHTLRYRDMWDVWAVDMKRVELGPMRRYSNVKSVATRIEDAESVLEGVRQEMMHRYELLEQMNVQNIAELNRSLKARGVEELKRQMVFVDEIAELVAEVGDESDEIRKSLKGTIDSLVRLGRAAGVHCVLATQRPDAQFISGATKSNIGARIAMGSLSANGANMALEATPEFSGISGRGWWFRQGQPLTEVQVYYTSTKDLDRLERESS